MNPNTLPLSDGNRDKIKCRRYAMNLSLDALAEKTGLSKSFLGKIERGDKNPSSDSLGIICDCLGMEFTCKPVKVTIVIKGK